MPLVCPECKQLYEQNGICPLCNVVLLYHAAGFQSDPTPTPTVDDVIPQWQQTPWGKIVVGIILAQGLSFGLLQLLTAGFLASGDGADVWQTLWGIVLHHCVHAVSLLIGGSLAGAGQRRGIIFGAFIGLISGIISLFWQQHNSESFSSILIYAEPMIHLAIGAIGGGLGMLIWRPIPRLPDIDGDTPAPVVTPSFHSTFGNLFSGPVFLGRVCAGAFVIVVGVVWSKAIMEFLLRASNGTLTISSQLQAQLVSMEIAALFALLGAGFAGATTRNGFKQGLCVGIAASVIVLGIQIAGPRFTVESGLFTMAGIITITLVGGWFGGQLFPPVDPARRKKRLAYHS